MDTKEPELPPNHFETYEPEPVKAMPYTGPKPAKVLVAGKPNNRRYRRAERAFNKKAEAEFNKKTAALVKRTLNPANDVLGKVAAVQKALEPLLQTSAEPASPATPLEQESSP